MCEWISLTVQFCGETDGQFLYAWNNRVCACKVRAVSTLETLCDSWNID